jgi:fructan beta-fructosidase
VEGESGLTKWVLKVDVLKGTGAQYFVGDFDGTQFTDDAANEEIKRVDFGEDFYAAQSWSDEPNGRRIWIAWMSNWHYANDTPTSPWRGCFSIPRQLHLWRFAEGLRLVQQPVAELQKLTKSIYYGKNVDIASINAQLAVLKMDAALEIDVEFMPDSARASGLKICTGAGEETLVGYDAESQELFIDRRLSGTSSFSDHFAEVHRAPLVPEGGKISMHIVLDSCSVEVFGNEGRVVISDLIFPQSQDLSLEFYVHDGDARVDSLDIRRLVDKP